MKKNPARAQKQPMPRIRKTVLLILTAVVVIAAAVSLTVALINRARVNTLVGQQNYVASKLIEMGSYEDGRILAMKSEQTRSNDTSRTLIVLAAGFSAEYEAGMEAADRYLADRDYDLLSETRTVLEAAAARNAAPETDASAGGYTASGMETVLDDATRDELLAVLLRVQGTIKVKKNAAAVQAMQEMLATGSIQTVSVDALQDDSSLLSKKVQTLSAIQRGEYDAAYDAAESLFSADGSFENRALLANLAATGHVAADNTAQTAETSEKLNRLYVSLSEAQNEYDTMVNTAYDERKQKTLYDNILQIETEIENTLAAMVREPVKRAINFIETTTPVTQRDTTAYRVELSSLYYRAGDEETAAELIIEDLLDAETVPQNADPVTESLAEIVTQYRASSGGAGRLEERRMIWQRIAQILGIIENEYDDNNYFTFLGSVLDRVFRGLQIRAVDASDFPTVRVTVNVATDEGGNLGRGDFTVLDMQEKVSGIRMIDAEDIDITSDMSVMLVVDRSGSMGGDPIVHTKSAVVNFVKNTDAAVNMGLVAFDSSAELMSPLGASRTQLLTSVDAVNADGGGTNIQAGLALAGETLGGVPGRRIIILISDGSDGNPDGIDAVLESLQQHSICVYTIAFGGADTDYLSYIADSTGGKFLQSDTSTDISGLYEAIGEYMVNDYIIEFDATVAPEDFSRSIRVSLDDSHAVADSDYTVGVAYSSIVDEANLAPSYNAYRQTGGSGSGT